MNSRTRPTFHALLPGLVLAVFLIIYPAPLTVAQEPQPDAVSAPAAVPDGPGMYSQTAFAFRPLAENVPYLYDVYALFNPDVSNHAYIAPVALPNGATVTRLRVWYYDNAASDMSVRLRRASLSSTGAYLDLASVLPTGASTGVHWGEDTSIAYAAIDNTTYAYYVYVFLPPSPDLRIVGFRIDYDYTAVIPTVMK